MDEFELESKQKRERIEQFFSFNQEPSTTPLTPLLKWVIIDDHNCATRAFIKDGDNKSGTINDLYQYFENNIDLIEDKTKGKFIIPCSFIKKETIDVDGEDCARRLAVNVKDWYFLPIDVDKGMTLDEARERWKDYQYILYTSWSHRLKGIDKFRLLIPFSSPISSKNFEVRRDSIKQWLGDGVDLTCLSQSRGFYTPSCCRENGAEFVLEMNEGQYLNWLNFDVTVEVHTKSTNLDYETTDNDKQLILEQLRRSSINSYNLWWQMIAALKGAGFSVGDAIYVSGDNSLHASDSLPVKSSKEIAEYWNRQRVSGTEQQNIGKLIKMIRRTEPTFGLNQERVQNQKCKNKLDMFNQMFKENNNE